MNVFRRLRPRPSLSWLARGPLSLIVVWALLAPTAFAQGNISVPSQPYFLALPAFYNGQYAATSAVMATCLSGAIKNPAAGGFWIDTICYETMQGECAYQLGNHAGAILHYEAALNLLIRFNNWMLSVQFPPVLGPMQPQYLKPIPWYMTTRQTVPGEYPLQMNIMQGNINNNAAIIRGGIVQQPVLMPLYVQEIVRCSCLAIRRYRELLGPACPHSKTTQRLLTAMAAPIAWPNHWSQAWTDTQLGLAYAAAGKAEQARKTLSQAQQASGMFDHGLTGHCLLMQGVLDLESGDYKSAHMHFLEASWAAANYNDVGVIEEALHYAAVAHFLANGRLPYPVLAPAIAWATAASLGQMNTSLLLDAAENSSLCGMGAAAAGFLGEATVMAAGSNMLAGKIGARMNHLKALSAYQLGNVAGGDVALAAAMAFQTGGSLRLYQIGVVDVLWMSSLITERTAVDLYGTVLRDPTPADWLIDPLESLSVLYVPHPLSFEHWFEAALLRKAKEHELALQITDMARRHRFLVMLEHGGRLLNLRWLMEAPDAALDQTTLMQRQALMTRFPAYVKKMQRVRELRNELRRMPLVIGDDQEATDEQDKRLKELAQLSGEQEVLLREMAVGRDPANLVFPPVRSFKEVQESLADGQTILSFFDSSRSTYSFVLSKDKYTYNEIKTPKRFRSDLNTMLQKWGNFNQNKEMKIEELSSKAWQSSAQQIMNVLVKNSKADFTKSLNELVIVPEGVLWYVPFEALPQAGDHKNEPLINQVRIRYSPTVGLAVGEKRRRRPRQNLAVALGKLHPQAETTAIDREFEDLARALPKAEAIRGKLPCHGAIYSSLFDRLIVFNEVPPASGFDWSPLQIDNKMSGGTLGEWLRLPFKGPDQVILPAFRTPIERGLVRANQNANGSELFYSVCGLMAGGARTVLISRWRTGGQSSVDLVREFAQELPHTTASDAWQRSVQMVMHTQVDAAHEPRLAKLNVKQDPPTGEHPFFWAGYLLADTGALPAGDDEEDPDDQVIVAAPAVPGVPVAPAAAPAAPNAAPAAGQPAVANAPAGMNVPPGAKAEAAGVAPPRAANDAPNPPVAAPGKPGKPRRARPLRGASKPVRTIDKANW